MANLIHDLIGESEESSTVDIELINIKMEQANTPGVIVEFSPEEADYLGAFEDDSIPMKDIIEGSLDLINS